MGFELKKGVRGFAWIIILISWTTYTSCKLSFGGDSVDSEDDVSFAQDIERVSVSSAGIQARSLRLVRMVRSSPSSQKQRI